MQRDLEGRVAIVTGGAKGLGAAIVELFAESGARVMIADLDAEAGEALAAKFGDNAQFRRTDVSKAEDIQALVDETIKRFGGLHIMVNNAGVSAAFHPRLLDETLAEFDLSIRINLLGVMIGTQAAARHMAKAGGGVILNVSSTSGMRPGYGVMSYRTAKAAVIHFSQSAAIDLGAENIRVNCIAPGNIQTGMNAFIPEGVAPDRESDWKAYLESVRFASQPLKRRGTPRDIAEAALYLASDRAAQVTGVVLPVDGGFTAGDSANHMQEIIDAQAAAPKLFG